MDINPASRAVASATSAAGDGILHPAVFGAVLVLLVNDHVLKAAYPGVVTGKLSDVAGLVFFPFLLVGCWEVGLLVARRWREPSVAPVVIAVAATAIGFAAVKTIPAAAEAFASALSVGQWLPGAVWAVAVVRPAGTPATTSVIADPTDLIALPALAIPLLIGSARASAWPR